MSELQSVWKQAAYIAWFRSLKLGRQWPWAQYSYTGNKIEASVTDDITEQFFSTSKANTNMDFSMYQPAGYSILIWI